MRHWHTGFIRLSNTCTHDTLEYSIYYILHAAMQVIPLHFSAVQCSAVQCSAVQCSALLFSSLQCAAVQCSAVECSALHGLQYSTVKYSAVECSSCTVEYLPGPLLPPLEEALLLSLLHQGLHRGRPHLTPGGGKHCIDNTVATLGTPLSFVINIHNTIYGQH